MNTSQRTSLLALLLMFILCSTAWTMLNSNVGDTEIRITVVIIAILGALGISYYYWREIKKETQLGSLLENSSNRSSIRRTVPLPCCSDMSHALKEEKSVLYIPEFQKYGIRILDGGSSIKIINYCPWCGNQLPASLQKQ